MMRRTSIGAVVALGWGVVLGGLQYAHAAVPDHLKCYKIRDSLARQSYVVQMTDEFAGDQCTVGRATLFCAAAAKTAVVPAPPGGGPGGTATQSFVCYKAHCRFFPPETLVEDQFGRRVVRFSGGRLVCAPSGGSPGQTTTTSTTITSTTSTSVPTAIPCGSATARQCDGACPDPERQICRETNGTECGCTDFSCDAGSGLCPPEQPVCKTVARTCQTDPSRSCTTDADCVDAGGDCEETSQCASGTTPCSTAAAPSCEGVCPFGQFCEPATSGCHCVDVSCGVAYQGAPECWGVCPSELPVCRDTGGGGCRCSAF